MKQKGNNGSGYQGGSFNPNNSNNSGQKSKKINNMSDPYKSQSRSLVARDRQNGTGDAMNKAGMNALEVNIHRGSGSNPSSNHGVQGSFKNIRGSGHTNMTTDATSHTPQQSAFAHGHHHDLGGMPNQLRSGMTSKGGAMMGGSNNNSNFNTQMVLNKSTEKVMRQNNGNNGKLSSLHNGPQGWKNQGPGQGQQMPSHMQRNFMQQQQFKLQQEGGSGGQGPANHKMYSMSPSNGPQHAQGNMNQSANGQISPPFYQNAMRGAPGSLPMGPGSQQKKSGIHQMAGANIASNGQGSLNNSQNSHPVSNYVAQQQQQSSMEKGGTPGSNLTLLKQNKQQHLYQNQQTQGAPNNQQQVVINHMLPRDKKHIENLSRTGMEYPMMKDLGHELFNTNQMEFEKLVENPIRQSLLDEYMRNDADRTVNCSSSNTFQIVYDYFENSPFYEGENAKYGPYIDEKDIIELPSPQDQSNGAINEPYQKRYYFNPQNLPYSLEQNNHFGQVNTNQPQSKIAQQRQGISGPRLNRYYEKLKPYYRVNPEIKENANNEQGPMPGVETTDDTVSGKIYNDAAQVQLPADKTLVFESRFESGNLRKAMKVGPFEYDLFLKNDYSTQSFTQWYYFRIQNTRKDQTYRFNLCNFMKPDSTYTKGMRPLVYSLKDATEGSQFGWQRECQNIAYYQTNRTKRAFKNQNSSAFRGNKEFSPYQILNQNINTLQPNNDGYGQNYYCLTFEYTAKFDCDTVYFAHCYPYTYTDLCRYVSQTCTYENKDKVRKTVLCKSLAGNDVDMLIVTNFGSAPEEIAVRKAIILTARVHPGESNASYMMKGCIDFLVSDDPKAQQLRDTFVFKIIPMLNPDGVIVGNYRCSLVGQDLNRQWIGSSAKLYPINYHTKLMMKKTQESREIFFFCDFHGHSTGRNVFMYGNAQTRPSDRLKEKVFPVMFAEMNENFSFDDCSFVVHKSKDSCSRVVMWREFNLVNSYTCEASFCGPTRGIHSGCHFNAKTLEEVGHSFCRTLVEMGDKERCKKVLHTLQIRYPVNAQPAKRGYLDDDEEEDE